MSHSSTSRSHEADGGDTFACTMRVAPVAACLLLALSGCAHVASRATDPTFTDVPSNWSMSAPAATSGVTSLVEWWSRFEDPLLTRLVADALQANTTVTGAGAALRQARALREVAEAALYPTLVSSASARRSSGGSAAPTASRTTT